MKRFFYLSIVLVFLFTSCEKVDDIGVLVPPTVADDPSLPSISLQVAGRDRLVHYQTFGDSDNPVFFILHGSLSDMRVYLPMEVFSNKYFVVMWDMRGNGLSERCTKEELAIDNMVDEIEAMKNHFSPGQPITLMGHSWSAFFTARYVARYPSSVKQAIMIEPNGLKDSFMDEVGQSLNLFSEGYMDMMYANNYLTAKTHEELDYQALQMLPSAVRNFYCDLSNLPDWPVWRVGAYALMIWEKSILKNGKFNFDYTEGLEEFPHEVLLVGTECSPIGYEFQETFHQPLFQNAQVLRIEDSGHRLITEQFETLVAGLKAYLLEY
jgi:proline iminopeptidase